MPFGTFWFFLAASGAAGYRRGHAQNCACLTGWLLLSRPQPGNGRVIEYDYDNLQRLVQELWKQSSTTLNTIDYAYDAASQLTAIADDVSAYAYVYDGLGRVTQVDNAGTSVGPNVVFHSTYNAAGWRTTNRAVVDGTNDFINTYNYDNIGRLEYVQQVEHGTGNSVAEKRVDFAYNAAGQYESTTRYTDITQTNLVAATTFAYDDAHRLTGLSHDKGLTNLAGYSWTYDTSGRLTSVTNVDGTDAYAYDDTGQLIDVDSTYQTDETYTYDANGNRTLAGYTTGDNNQLTSDGTYDYEYDDEGNRTKKTHISSGDYIEYAWDHRNRLTAVTFRNSSDVKTKEVTYVYDVYDRRIAKDVDDNGDSTIDWGERYAYDGSDIALVYDRSDNLVERLLYGPGVDQPLASEDGSGDVLWFLADNQGTIRDVAEYDDTTDTTSVVNHIQYGGFGNITAQSNASNEPRHIYTGREWDADSDLFYYRARWYDPVVGRFISEDPIGFSAGDANLSRFVGNSSTNYVDPSGLEETVLFVHSKSRVINNFEAIGESYYNHPTHDNVLDATTGSLPSTLDSYSQEHGLIDLLFIGDHGATHTHEGTPTGDYSMRLGGDVIQNDLFKKRGPYLSDDAIIILGGCNVGSDGAYCTAAARASGASVCASTGIVTYGGIQIPFSELTIPTRFHSDGKWKFFPAPGVDVNSLPAPGDLHLNSH